jgi:hypothetical protein
MVISIDAENIFDKLQFHFIFKTLSKLGMEGKYLKVIKGTYAKLKVTTVVIREKLKPFPQKSGISEVCVSRLPLLTQYSS